MTFETEDVPFAGTDATVYVQLFGEKGGTEKIEFRSENKLEAPKFKRGRIDKFAVETSDVGQVIVETKNRFSRFAAVTSALFCLDFEGPAAFWFSPCQVTSNL